jgi:hypothetical protein
MALKMMKVGLTPALVAAVALLGATDAYAQRKITRLGSPATRLTAPIRDTAALQRTFTNKRNQTNISQVLDKAGLTSITPQVLAALTEGKVTETSVAPGTPIRWMGLRRAGKADIVTDAVWAGTKPFDGFAFTIDDGDMVYNFVVPKACGNLSLMSSGPSPAKQAAEAARRAEEEKRRAAEAAAAAAAKAKAEEEARKEAERKAFEALPPACGVTATPMKVKGGYDIVIDGTGATAGRKPAETMTVQIIGPLGQPIPVSYEGSEKTEWTAKTPFKGTVFVKKPKAGTYTLRVTTVAGQAKNTCEATAVVPEYDMVDWFADGTFGKQRRQYDVVNADGVDLSPGFCDPQLAFKGGPLFWFADYKASFAPAIGLAFQFGDLGDYDFDPNEYNNVSLLAEAVVNYHFSPRGAFIGTGFGWWDLFDTDHNTGAWIVNFGVPVSDSDTSSVLFIGEGRLFFANNDQSSNYNIAAGVRFIMK